MSLAFQLIQERVNVQPLIAQIDAQPQLWDARPERRVAPDSPHADMRDIWVRYNRIERLGPNFNDEHVPVWYPAWHALPAMRPIVFGLMALVDGEMLGGVLITKIPPGGKIKRHVDIGWHVENYDKFYVTLRSKPGAVFNVDHDGHTESLCPVPGQVWLFDNRHPHWVDNNSDSDRMTLIVCIRTEKFGRNECLSQ